MGPSNAEPHPLDTFVDQPPGSIAIRMTRAPEELVFDPTPEQAVNFFAALMEGPRSGDVPSADATTILGYLAYDQQRRGRNMAVDITRPETLHTAGEHDEGTGIYWFAETGGRFEQVFVPNITRGRAVELAQDFTSAGRQKLDAYRWVPNSFEDVALLVKSMCTGACTGDLDCVNNACRCINGKCRRK
jgi:hypothetical protein